MKRLLLALLAICGATLAHAQDSNSAGLQLLLMGQGLHTNDWGTQTNANLQKIEDSIVGVTSLTVTGGTTVLTDTQARSQTLKLSGTLSSNVILTYPTRARQWCVINGTTMGSFTITASAGAGTTVSIPAGTSCFLSDGTNATNTDGRAYALATTANTTANTASTTATAAMPKSGGTFTGAITLSGDPSSALQPATKQYADTFCLKSGCTMTGAITLPGVPSSSLQAATKGYVDSAVSGLGSVTSVTGSNGVVTSSSTGAVGVSTDTTYGAIGTYSMSSTSCTPGTNYAAASVGVNSGVGTWRCMGAIFYSAGGVGVTGGLYIRVS